MLGLVSQLTNKTGIPFPLANPEKAPKKAKVAALARVCDELWWRRKVRTKQWRELEALAREMGLVSLKRGAYVSDFTFKRRWLQKQENRALLEALEAINEEGATYTLAELADLSTSNPAIRRAEMMVRTRGFEEIAKHSTVAYQAMFYTITCPSKFHSALHYGGANPKYQGSTPREAQEYLNTQWQRARAAFGRKDIQPYGMRVTEPHHDGTPHWHLLLFIPANQAAQATEILRHYALAEDGDEPGAALRRFTAETIDPKKGSATGYIAKYISKNIDGLGIDADSYGRDAKESAIRIEAWASVWGIRQFQQIGGPSVTVWRELRRLDSTAEDKDLLQRLVAAADSSDWEEYTRLMGGAICARKARPLRPMMITREALNKYGEAVKTLKGLLYGVERVATRVHEWTVRLVSQNVSQATADAEVSAIQSDHIQHMNPYLLAPPSNFAPLEFCQ
ncbi:replication endonuclease [Marinimicrobium locisalis]|uniref:replication endonuclease n=1 Tax=Marinimicrobium locisalis TaxID=546022 RepID=UPI003221CDBC